MTFSDGSSINVLLGFIIGNSVQIEWSYTGNILQFFQNSADESSSNFLFFALDSIIRLASEDKGSISTPVKGFSEAIREGGLISTTSPVYHDRIDLIFRGISGRRISFSSRYLNVCQVESAMNGFFLLGIGKNNPQITQSKLDIGNLNFGYFLEILDNMIFLSYDLSMVLAPFLSDMPANSGQLPYNCCPVASQATLPLSLPLPLYMNMLPYSSIPSGFNSLGFMDSGLLADPAVFQNTASFWQEPPVHCRPWQDNRFHPYRRDPGGGRASGLSY